MARSLPRETWDVIKIKYETGSSLRSLEREYGISEGTIRHRRDREKWTQELRNDVIEIAEKINKISKHCAPAQMDVVNSVIDKMTQRLNIINNIVDGGLNLAQMNMRDALRETNPRSRIMMANMMKVTLPDLLKMTGIDSIHKKEEDEEDNSVVKFYLPENGRD